ncbi:glycosyltransferase family 2 protein [Pedobacter aquatilis]|uniref:glycosyltransferase family 2 protein n=1 Tax=Pedobacter aquatilis TaxID=351343 RepID=UPI00292E3A89|nr:glycosyltransferase family 2 protein [Pedobacter aquatilis]
MPAYNADKFIKEAIDSVINQIYKKWELIVIDDGSTDQTPTIAKNFVDIDTRISYYYQRNGKQGKARNFGITKSRGEFISFLDADDLWTDDKLSTQFKALKQDFKTDLIFSQGYKLKDNKREDYDLHLKDCWDKNDFDRFLDQNQIPILSVLVKKQVISSVNNFTERIEIQNVEDYHLWLKLLILGSQFKSIANRLFYYRIHSGQVTFENTNISIPKFNAYLDIYHFTKKKEQKQAIINKIKWELFTRELHKDCIDISCIHLKNKGLNILSIAIQTFFSGQQKIKKRIAFQIISKFG